jgi:hypothetical protein
MTDREFCCWLKGYLSDRDIKKLDENQLKTIKTQLSRIYFSLDKLEYKTPAQSIKIDPFDS